MLVEGGSQICFHSLSIKCQAHNVVLVVGVVRGFVGPGGGLEDVVKELLCHWQSYKTYLQL